MVKLFKRPPSSISISNAHAAIAGSNVHQFAWVNPDTSHPLHLGPLNGIPISVKSAFSVKDVETTASSDILEGYKAPYTSTAVQLLLNSGAYIVGKTAQDEFGMGSKSTHLSASPPVHPLSDKHSPGGSSGGSAASVLSGTSQFSLGTDTGGSTRLPASHCGIVGLKPSYGMISRWGLISYADSLDCVGVMGSEVTGVEQVFNVISQPDAKDPTCASESLRRHSAALSKLHISTLPNLIASSQASVDTPLKGLRVGLPLQTFPTVPPPLFVSLLSKLQSLGADLVSIDIPILPHVLGAYYVIASAEASSNLARYDGVRYGKRIDEEDVESVKGKLEESDRLATRTKGFGNEVRKRLLVGSYALSAEAYNSYFLRSQRIRSTLLHSYLTNFRSQSPLYPSLRPAAATKGIDIILHPTSLKPPSLIKPTKPAEDEEIDAYIQDTLTVPASLCGLPAISIPMGLDGEGWPRGVDIMGQWGSEELLFRLGEVIEGVIDMAPLSV